MGRNQTTYLITKPDGEDITAVFKWTVSRGRDTYGYNICSLYIDGNKVSNCNGGGYDMQGTAFGYWLEAESQEELRHLTANYGSSDNNTGFYGLSFWNHKTRKRQKRWSDNCKKAQLDGACGFSSMETIAKKLGYKLKYIS